MSHWRDEFNAAVRQMVAEQTNRTMHYMTPEEFHNLPQYHSVPRDKPDGFVFRFSWALRGNPTYGDTVRAQRIKAMSKVLDGEVIHWNTFRTLDVTLTHSRDNRVLV